ncbi:MAG: GntR family transcriptional regulator [Clostridia bacterium]|nr:GntR family transcriptional regulator [Clostridia bacterium]
MEYKTVSLADQIYEQLENHIITGVYPRGEIITEMKLVEQLGVSRTPIREALRRLEQERLIKDTGKGSIVLGITLEDMIDIMNIRQRVEGLAAYYATENMTPEGLEKLRQLNDLQDFYYTRKDAARQSQMDDLFHDTIYELSQRTIIRDTLQPLHRKTMRYRKISLEDPARLGLSIQEHKDIFNAMAAGNAELAEELTVQHIINAKNSMMTRLKNNG